MPNILVPNAQQEGIVDLGTYSFTAVATMTLPRNIFSTAFDNYLIDITYGQNTTAANPYFYFMSGGNTVISSYYSGGQGWSSAGAAINKANSNATIVNTTSSAVKADAGLNALSIKVFNPLTTGRKNFIWENAYWNSSDIQNYLIGGGFTSASNSCDSLAWEVSGGTMTGTMIVYGMRK
jgi:hypothetical protein